MLAKQWIENARNVMDQIESTQMKNIKAAAEKMADSIEQERWVHTFGCGHATLPIEEMYPRIGAFVGFFVTTKSLISIVIYNSYKNTPRFFHCGYPLGVS